MILGLFPMKVLFAGAFGSALSTVMGGGTMVERSLRGLFGVGFVLLLHHVLAIILVGAIDFVLDEPHLPTVAEMEPIGGFLAGLIGMVACQMIFNVAVMLQRKAPEFVGEHLDPDSK